MSKPKIGIIISSTRDTRFADKPAQWILDLAQQRDDLDAELIDLRDYDLPFFNEAASNLWMPSTDERAVAWQNKIAEYDGFIFVVAEYNRSITGVLKNAIDQAYNEWNRKPAAYVGYGAVGAARAIEHLRLINVETQMAPVRAGVHIGGSDFFKVHPLGANGPISDIEAAILPGAKDMLDNLVWWANALKVAREDEARVAAE
ncbi:NADPH-dependent FMN reductase [Pelagibacterium xiamenense]|uniref:NADPH-dependent FMN reductase n=1 Tax=Pelagibacterium xiamenense TaxID=2901140 RepID=UPI001E450F15|nr:NAD(P)H-dependent oxidoreductase [Pelagibacterium xiamenense]MCD7060076.1 NAD(P)H-dependent oxidoreductase [Pelagibacterium xiamenense]